MRQGWHLRLAFGGWQLRLMCAVAVAFSMDINNWAYPMGDSALVCERLQLVCTQAIVVPQHMVMCRPRSSLDSSMADQEKVMICGMCNCRVHHCACSNASLMYLKKVKRKICTLRRSAGPMGTALEHCDDLIRHLTC